MFDRSGMSVPGKFPLVACAKGIRKAFLIAERRISPSANTVGIGGLPLIFKSCAKLAREASVRRNWLHVAVCGLGLALLTGCAGIPNTLPPKALAKVEHTHVNCYFPQSAVDVEYMQSGYGGGGGLIGALIDAGINSAMASSARSRAEKLQAVVRDFDFHGKYWGSISNVLDDSSWLKLQAVDLKHTTVVRVRAEDIATHSILNLGTDYEISPDMRVLQINTGIGCYVPGKHKKPSASIMMVYHSKEISPDEGDKALEAWMAEDGQVYCEKASEGIEESIKMLHHALNIMGDGDQRAYRPATIKARLIHGRGTFGIPVGRMKLKGRVLEQTSDRVMFKVDKGAIYSFPLEEVTLKLAKSK